MRIGVPSEIHAGEKRVAIVPEVVDKLRRLGFSIAVESGAGEGASCSDEAYRAAGAEVLSRAELWAAGDIVLKVRAPEVHPELAFDEVDSLREGSTLVCFIWPAQNPGLLQRLAERRATVMAMDCVPRLSRAQKLDALSSMSNIAGYRAVIEAAHHFGRFFAGQVTAAGKVPPAKVFVIGVGVAGLAAIGAARGLGAIVRASDTRPEVRDQVKSLGAEFVGVDGPADAATAGGYAKLMSEDYQKAQLELYSRQAMDVDIIITTALIPGRPAPKLISAGMVASMRPGSVIVDLAAEQGGNCELTVPAQVVIRHGVSIIGYTDLPSRLARQASTLYATNLLRLLDELCPARDGTLHVRMDDDVIRSLTVVHNGVISWPAPPVSVSAPRPAGVTTLTPVAVAKPDPTQRTITRVAPAILLGLVALLFLWVGAKAPPAFLSHFTVFVLSCIVGYLVIWNVTPALHTPLMSVTNVISSIITIGALVQISSTNDSVAILAGAAIVLTSVNMAGGYWVTRRMLAMFRK